MSDGKQKWNRGLEAEGHYVAGQLVPPGIYREIESGRLVRLEREDHLPASFDGQVACYEAYKPYDLKYMSEH